MPFDGGVGEVAAASALADAGAGAAAAGTAAAADAGLTAAGLLGTDIGGLIGAGVGDTAATLGTTGALAGGAAAAAPAIAAASDAAPSVFLGAADAAPAASGLLSTDPAMGAINAAVDASGTTMHPGMWQIGQYLAGAGKLAGPTSTASSALKAIAGPGQQPGAQTTIRQGQPGAPRGGAQNLAAIVQQMAQRRNQYIQAMQQAQGQVIPYSPSGLLGF